jgi:transposase
MKRSNYLKEDLTIAVHEYKNGSTSSAVSAKYGIPRSTIRNHKSNSKLKIGGGRPALLTNHQEQYLVELLINLEFVGVRLTKPVVMKLSSEYVQFVTGKYSKKLLELLSFIRIIISDIGNDIQVGRKWLKTFLQRWDTKLKVLKEEKMEISRRNGFSEDVRRGWYEKLDLILRENNLITRPHAIFNCDESGFSDETASKSNIL